MKISAEQKAYLLDHLDQSEDAKLRDIGVAIRGRPRGRRSLTTHQKDMRRLWSCIGRTLVRKEVLQMRANGERHRAGNVEVAEAKVAANIFYPEDISLLPEDRRRGIPVGVFTARIKRYGKKRRIK